jgi:hypothetical protein
MSDRFRMSIVVDGRSRLTEVRARCGLETVASFSTLTRRIS